MIRPLLDTSRVYVLPKANYEDAVKKAERITRYNGGFNEQFRPITNLIISDHGNETEFSDGITTRSDVTELTRLVENNGTIVLDTCVAGACGSKGTITAAYERAAKVGRESGQAPKVFASDEKIFNTIPLVSTTG